MQSGPGVHRHVFPCFGTCAQRRVFVKRMIQGGLVEAEYSPLLAWSYRTLQSGVNPFRGVHIHGNLSFSRGAFVTCFLGGAREAAYGRTNAQRDQRATGRAGKVVDPWGVLTFPSFSAFSSSSGVRSGRIASATIKGKKVSAALTTWICKSGKAAEKTSMQEETKGDSSANKLFRGCEICMSSPPPFCGVRML